MSEPYEARRPYYKAELAGGVERFLESRRDAQQVAGDGRGHTPGLVERERAGGQMANAGVLARADAVLHAGMWAMAGFVTTSYTEGRMMTASEIERTDPNPFPTLVSVIIPARNAAAVLPGQLDALVNQDYDQAWEVVVVDNDSHDETASVALAWETRLPRLRVVTASRRGTHHARNVGATAAKGDVLLFCDADDVAMPNWLREMAEASRTADIVGGYLDFDTLNSARARSSRAPSPRDRLPVIHEFLPYAVGACIGVRADVFTALGGFNETYPYGGGEDVEFCWRAQLASYSVGFAQDAVMCYRLRDRLWPIARQAFCYGRGDVRLFRDFHRHGISATDARERDGQRQWFIRRLEHLFSSDRAPQWTFEFAWRLGRLVGSLNDKVWCP